MKIGRFPLGRRRITFAPHGHVPSDTTLFPLRAPLLRIGPSTIHRRGVFAIGDAAAGETLEQGPLLVVPRRRTKRRQLLSDYVFHLDDVRAALLLGQSSLCNHHAEPNAEVHLDGNALTFVVRSLRSIRAGEEIFLDYGSGYWAKRLSRRKLK